MLAAISEFLRNSVMGLGGGAFLAGVLLLIPHRLAYAATLMVTGIALILWAAAEGPIWLLWTIGIVGVAAFVGLVVALGPPIGGARTETISGTEVDELAADIDSTADSVARDSKIRKWTGRTRHRPQKRRNRNLE